MKDDAKSRNSPPANTISIHLTKRTSHNVMCFINEISYFSFSIKLTYMFYLFGIFSSSELEESLLVLPFTYVIDLLKLINRWVHVSTVLYIT